MWTIVVLGDQANITQLVEAIEVDHALANAVQTRVAMLEHADDLDRLNLGIWAELGIAIAEGIASGALYDLMKALATKLSMASRRGEVQISINGREASIKDLLLLAQQLETDQSTSSATANE